jgi:hypothetical protein
MPLMSDREWLEDLSKKHFELLNKVNKMDLETSEELRRLSTAVDQLHRGLYALSDSMGPEFSRRIEAVMYVQDDKQKLMLDAGAECLTPEQYEKYVHILGARGDTLWGDTAERLYNCIMKRVPK